MAGGDEDGWKAGTGGGKDSVCLREFSKGGMKVTCTVDDVTTVRNYKRV